ncbi:hypothetical protein KAS24_06360 [Candidatus Bathyarchaeota archaeon]|nr:hypothetical protein [Candidatus Bathyarchaeota archaeon]
MPEALLAEDFKSCKTLKQENASQERSKGILTKAWRKNQSTKFLWATPLIKIGLKNEKTEKSEKNDK